MKKIAAIFLSIIVLFTANTYATAAQESSLLDIQHRWAEANYQLGGDSKIKAFNRLRDDIDALLTANPDDANLLIWRGITQSTLAGVKKGLGALSLAKQAKQDLESAMAINDKALEGSAYTSLGTLYHKVPGWPVGFGNDKKARQMLMSALSINPDGIDPNYFFGEYLYDKGEYSEARKYLQVAKHAAPRPARPVADEGRQHEIELLLKQVEKKLVD
ncbi:MAG: hypothetical protein WBN40_09090 [Pseudomonadales bacterium]